MLMEQPAKYNGGSSTGSENLQDPSSAAISDSYICYSESVHKIKSWILYACWTYWKSNDIQEIRALESAQVRFGMSE